LKLTYKHAKNLWSKVDVVLKYSIAMDVPDGNDVSARNLHLGREVMVVLSDTSHSVASRLTNGFWATGCSNC
jgi:hypothetical protein